MATKGMSNLFGNNTRSLKDKPTGSVAFKFATHFNPAKLEEHFYKHGKEMNSVNLKDYERRAIKFANHVDSKNCVCYIDNNKTTYKYNLATNDLVIVKSNGMIISYYKPVSGFYVNGEKIRR